ncbi:tRNA1(Val) (adenine(37)-N6)-methyltransferase [Pseudosulfitobacter koreensis]|nr:methyltransferase [Pseudosulfitobacter koreense]
MLWQPRVGYRSGLDPVLLAASVPAKAGQSVLDLGCGAGAAALCLGARVPGLILHGVERQPYYADLAARNGLDVTCADITALPMPLKERSFDHVIANPPFFDRAAGRPSPYSGREGALGEDTALEAWVQIAAKRLRYRGLAHFVHRMARLPDLLAGIRPVLGSVEVQPFSARPGRAPELCIIRARKGGRAEFRLHFPRLLHRGEAHLRDAESYTPEIKAVLRDGAALEF